LESSRGIRSPARIRAQGQGPCGHVLVSISIQRELIAVRGIVVARRAKVQRLLSNCHIAYPGRILIIASSPIAVFPSTVLLVNAPSPMAVLYLPLVGLASASVPIAVFRAEERTVPSCPLELIITPTPFAAISPFSVAAVCVCNPDRTPAGIHG